MATQLKILLEKNSLELCSFALMYNQLLPTYVSDIKNRVSLIKYPTRRHVYLWSKYLFYEVVHFTSFYLNNYILIKGKPQRTHDKRICLDDSEKSGQVHCTRHAHLFLHCIFLFGFLSFVLRRMRKLHWVFHDII